MGCGDRGGAADLQAIDVEVELRRNAAGRVTRRRDRDDRNEVLQGQRAVGELEFFDAGEPILTAGAGDVNAAIGFGDDRVIGPVAQVSRRVVPAPPSMPLAPRPP